MKTVHFIKSHLNYIQKGQSAVVTPLDHTSDLVSNIGIAITSTVQSVCPDGSFYTENSHYVPVTSPPDNYDITNTPV